jgi:hypothetical protein
MWNFQYKHGDRPLDGYTIQRGAGRGGFGEVYYAISDSGREVALKAVLGYEQIELRGISQCMNLKNPHLVSIFDVKHNDQGRPFVIMEFVSGPSLRQILDESPAGLGTQKAAFFLREIGKGLTYLHDNGIVHRDLKPANIFFENGYVKIGDYGLSKVIAATAHTTQTVTVGTVHYMAPEVGAGKYDRGIDIYAMGAVLFEMITGMVPFNGASPSEILLKHLSADADCTGIPEPFCTVIKKAMSKDPTQRYQSIQEMVEAVFGAEHVRQSVSVFSPDQLSVVAAHTAQHVAGAAKGGSGSESKQNPAGAAVTDPWPAFADRMANVSNRLGQVGLRVFGGKAAENNPPSSRTMAVEPPIVDPLSGKQRFSIAMITAVVAGIVAGCFPRERGVEPIAVMFFVFLASLGGALGVFLAARHLTPQLKGESEIIQRLAAGGLATLFAAVFSLPFWSTLMVGKNLPGLWVPVMVPLFCMNSQAWAASNRKQRVDFWENAFLAGLFAWIVSCMFSQESYIPVVTMMAICMVTQVLSPWDANAPRPRGLKEKVFSQLTTKFQTATGSVPPLPAIPAIPMPGARFQPPPPRTYRWRPVNSLLRVIWLIAMIISLGLGVALTVAAVSTARSNDFPLLMAFGVALMFGSLVFGVQLCRSRFYGWWSYVLKPLLIILLTGTVLGSSFMLAMGHLRGDEFIMAIFLLVACGQALLVVPFIPARKVIAVEPGAAEPPPPISEGPRNLWQSRRAEWVESRRVQRAERRALRRQRHTQLLNGSSFLMIAAVIVTLAYALNVPEALSVGLPDARFSKDLHEKWFNGYPAWPELLNRLLAAAALLLTVLTIALTAMARRHAGIAHILRGIIGVALLVSSAGMIRNGFHPSAWSAVASQVHQDHPGAAIAVFLDSFRDDAVSAACIMFVVASVLLAWTAPAPRAQVAAAPKQEGAAG